MVPAVSAGCRSSAKLGRNSSICKKESQEKIFSKICIGLIGWLIHNINILILDLLHSSHDIRKSVTYRKYHRRMFLKCFCFFLLFIDHSEEKTYVIEMREKRKTRLFFTLLLEPCQDMSCLGGKLFRFLYLRSLRSTKWLLKMRQPIQGLYRTRKHHWEIKWPFFG